jgi:hypothetical protein
MPHREEEPSSLCGHNPQMPATNRSSAVGRKLRVAGLALFAFLVCLASSARCREVDSGLAITDPHILKLLDKIAGIGQMMPSVGTAEVSNKELFARPLMLPILEAISNDIATASAPTNSGALFNINFLTSASSRFVLAGVINRMDRAWAYLDRDPDSCGEIRFVYRLTYHIELAKGSGRFLDSRLPMTLNLVLRAHDLGDSISCADIAKRWLDTPDHPADLKEIADTLANCDQRHVDRVEINMQSARWTASSPGSKDFGGRADYILRVFAFDTERGIFAPTVMENQIDRDRLLKPENGSLLAALKEFLLDPANIVKLDQGTLKVPDIFLATKGVSVAPGGIGRSANRILSDLVNAQDPDVVAAVEEVASKGLINIHSPYGFERRLDDITCSGCHQSRSTAGFHFIGIDWGDVHPNNATQVAGSPHFFGDMPRRREIVTAFAEGRAPGFMTAGQRIATVAQTRALLRGIHVHRVSHAKSFSKAWRCEIWACACPSQVVRSEIHSNEVRSRRRISTRMRIPVFGRRKRCSRARRAAKVGLKRICIAC